ncbi:MAG: hypothetical protein JETCAE03_36020 [Ignavibacteriaceae bacterium]|jgi:hypothetical protein|nr:MAG: hypothetical protein JETCAE03_36020 [Ignavibacteriaceae bacterium]
MKKSPLEALLPKRKNRKEGKKSRKHGRMKKKPAYKRYLAENRRAKNKARRIARYMKKFPNWKPVNLSVEMQTLVNRYIR